VLSFKGLAFNLGYGALGLLYAGLLALLRDGAMSPASEIAVFRDSLPWLLGYGIIACLLFVALVAAKIPALARLDATPDRLTASNSLSLTTTESETPP